MFIILGYFEISVWLCTFSLAIAIGAVLLLPISIASNEVLLLYPNSYYVKWLNSSLIHGTYPFRHGIYFISNQHNYLQVCGITSFCFPTCRYLCYCRLPTYSANRPVLPVTKRVLYQGRTKRSQCYHFLPLLCSA